jgi:hypothetical protein
MARFRRRASTHEDIVKAVRDATGMSLGVDVAPYDGTASLSGRLEDGSWMMVTDPHGRMRPSHADLAQRERDEAVEGPGGWSVSFCRNSRDSKGRDFVFNDVPFHEHTDETAGVHDLPGVINRALSTMPHGKGGGARADIDYEGLVNPRDDLDDDFGNIFGDRS